MKYPEENIRRDLEKDDYLPDNIHENASIRGNINNYISKINYPGNQESTSSYYNRDNINDELSSSRPFPGSRSNIYSRLFSEASLPTLEKCYLRAKKERFPDEPDAVKTGLNNTKEPRLVERESKWSFSFWGLPCCECKSSETNKYEVDELVSQKIKNL